jgi:hypothetical protein
MTHYPYEFFVGGRFGSWTVYGQDATGKVGEKPFLGCGPFFRKITAERVAQSLTQFYRTGYDMGIPSVPKAA